MTHPEDEQGGEDDRGGLRGAPPEAVPGTAAEGVEPAQEVPGGPQVDVPAGPGRVPPQRG